MDHKELKIVRLSVLVLSLAIIFVYIFWFNIKGDSIIELANQKGVNNPQIIQEEGVNNSQIAQEEDLTQSNNIIVDSHQDNLGIVEQVEEKNNISQTLFDELTTESLEQENTDSEDKSSHQNTQQVISFNFGNASTQNNKDEQEWFKPASVDTRTILDWTDIYNAWFDFDKKLALNYEYVLKDSRWIYYLYLWKGIDDSWLRVKVEELWWNLYTMNTEVEIINSGLFWDKIIFINLPEYKDKQVLMIVKIDDEYWLVYLPLETYSQSKGYLKNLFKV